MEKINFKEFKLYKNIAKNKIETIDVREMVADLLYNNAIGLGAHRLAYKIYDGENEFSKEEINVIIKITDALCIPAFKDSLLDNIK